MDRALKDRFLKLWNKFLPGAPLPIVFFYADEADPETLPKPPKGHRCMVCELARVRRGRPLAFNMQSIGCGGGRRYTGFAEAQMPDFEYFLSCGIPGKLEGERYKKTPELVREHLKHQTAFKAPADYIVFRRWDRVGTAEEPLVAVFFASPDVLSGLFTLANYDEGEPFGVIAPFCAGCASIIDYPLKEAQSRRPRAVLGMFDVSARPCVPSSELTFAVPWSKFLRMVDNMGESFFVTKSWQAVKKRIRKDLQTGKD
jgi:uncharacterized protein (DUF169 family)